MRPTTVVSLLFAGWALLSQSPATYAAPVPSIVNTAGVKRCTYSSCRLADPSGPDTASQSGVLGLVAALIKTLQEYQLQNTPTNTTAADFATPGGTGDDPVPVVDALEFEDDPV